MPRVYHVNTAPTGAVYIGRPSAYGNPFIIGVHGSRKECIRKYEDHVRSSPHL